MGVTTAMPPLESGPVRHRRVWRKNRLLRGAYGRAWRELAAFAVPGPSLEIGCGGGTLDGALPRCWKSDLVALPWADLAADAMRLPFRDAALANIVATDVLHHLPCPLEFLGEAARVLRPDGRVLLLEPYLSRVSYPIYRHLHREPADLRCACRAGVPTPAAGFGGDGHPRPTMPPGCDRCAGCAGVNQAIPTLLFRPTASPGATGATGAPVAPGCAEIPQLEIIHCRPRDAIVYPLSGGYSYPTLLPARLERLAWRIEGWLEPLMPLIGFRLAVVLRRRGQP